MGATGRWVLRDGTRRSGRKISDVAAGSGLSKGTTVGVELELHTGRPVRWDRERSRATLIRGSYEHGESLSEVLLGMDRTWRDRALWEVDPYGNTLFGEQQAQRALREVSDLLPRCSGPSQTAAVLDLERMLVHCAWTPGTHLWFIGD